MYVEPLFRVVVFGHHHEIQNFLPRTKRSLELNRISTDHVLVLDGDSPADRSLQFLNGDNLPVWFVQAGAWLPSTACSSDFEFQLKIPMPSASGRLVCALGCTTIRADERSPIDSEWIQWHSLLQASCGDIESARDLENILPEIRSCFLAPQLLPVLCSSLCQGLGFANAIRKLALSSSTRTIHWQPIDVHFDPRLRVVQVITSLQRGGAERIAIDLHESLSQRTHGSLLVSLGTPSRQSFASPSQTIDLSRLGLNHVGRLKSCMRACQHFAADVIHAHLLRNVDLAILSESGVPLVTTIHNTRSGWPDRLTELKSDTVSLLIACSLAVEKEASEEAIGIPTRTVWNGIRWTELTPKVVGDDSHSNGASTHRIDGEFVLTAIANPRPQKRLERLPAIAASLQRLLERAGNKRRVRLLIAGEASRDNDTARESVEKLRSAIVESGIESQIELLGPVANVSELLSNTDVLVSSAAHEGLSLAHLEALACNVPVVATDVGGTREIACRCPVLKLVQANASSEAFADALLKAVDSPSQSSEGAIKRDFSTTAMVSGYSRFYQRVVSSRSREAGSGLLLIINNFSTGGAQTSARRLLTGFHANGIRVRAAVLEEVQEFPTAGRQALLANGIDVMTLQCAGKIDPLVAIQPLLVSIDRNPPKTIVLWNAISEYKLLVADSIWGIPIVEVSPGEMLYSSFDRYWKRPRPGLPYCNPRDYGRRLSSVVVKYEAERATATSYFGTEVHVIPNGVSLKPCNNFLQPKQHVLIGTVARISPQKKLEELIEAIRAVQGRLPPLRVQIVGGVERGSEEYAKHLHDLSKGLPIEWIGERTNPSEFIASWDMFVLISEPAGCPNAGLEAMSHGLPLVATDVGGASEQVDDDVNGRLVPRGDITRLADAIVQLANDASLRSRYGVASHLRASTRFCEKRMLDDYCRVLGLGAPGLSSD